MGKPERRARESVSSSPSYFLRCFGVSLKVHSENPTSDAAGQCNKKKRTRWFSRPVKFRFKNNEITPTPIYETEKQDFTVEDDDDDNNKTLFRVIRHVTDHKNVAADEQKLIEKIKDDQRDINPEPLSYLGYKQASIGRKLDLTKTVRSSSKPREKTSRVKRGPRVGRFDPMIGISIIMLTLMIMLMWGRLCAILCTSLWCYFLPVIAAKRKRNHSDGGGGKAKGGSLPGELDFKSFEAYKKKVVLEGFLVRQHHIRL